MASKDQTSQVNAYTEAIKKNQQATESATKTQQKQNEVFKEIQETLKENATIQTESTEKQIELAEQLTETLEAARDNYEQTSTTVEGLSKTISEAVDNTKNHTSETSKSTHALKSLGKVLFKNFINLNKFGNVLKAVKGKGANAFSAIGKGFSAFGEIAIKVLDKIKAHPIVLIITEIFKVLMKIKAVFEAVFLGSIKIASKFVKTMVGLPLQILGSVAKIGHGFRRDVVEVVGSAIENVKEFIDVSDGMGASIKTLSESESTSLDKFLNVRGDFVKLFGYGSGGKAQFIADLAKGVQDMGQLADTVGGTISRNVDNAMYFVKATRSMGMATAEIEYMTAEAVKNGESIYAALDRVVIASDATSKQFGVDRKKLSKNFFELRKDITNFGHLSDRQIMETSAKLTQMGLSMKEAAAVFGKIDTFESAAQTSAMLSQTFGMNLDALQLLRAEKPEEIIEQFRDAMLSTGRSFDQLNRHEKSLMASHTGLTAEALKMTMNYRNLGMSYSDIQKKMKEDDPTQQQIKNLELMSGSLKKIQKTLTGENVFKNFTDGVLESMKAASGLSPILLRVSERFEDFFLSGLKVSKNAKSALEKAFSPFVTVLEKMVGDGKSKKGLLDADKFSGVFEEFAIKTGGFLERAFKGEDLKGLQGEIQNSLSSAFDFKNLNQGNTIVGKLMSTSGELIGQMLKAFAAFGPGLVNTVMDGFDSLVDFLWNYKSKNRDGDNSIVGMMMDLFKIDKEEGDVIIKSFTAIIDRVTSSTGPLLKLVTWLNSKFIGLVADTALKIGGVIWDSLFGYNSFMYQSFKVWSLNNPLGLLFRALGMFGDIGPFKSQEGIFKESLESNKGTSLSSLNLTSMAGDNYDEKQAEDVGKLYAALINEQKNAQGQTAVQIQSLIKKIDDQIGRNDLDSLRRDSVIKEIMASAEEIRGDKKSINLNVGKVKDDISSAKSKLVGAGGMALLKGTSDGLSLSQYAEGDQVVAGKDGGPVVNAIAYAGNAANAALAGIQGVVSALTGAPAPAAAGGLSEIRIFMQVDGNTLTEVVLDNDIIRKATHRKNGRVTLADGTVIDSSGNSIQGSSLT